MGEGQILTEDFVYGTLTFKPVSDAGVIKSDDITLQTLQIEI